MGNFMLYRIETVFSSFNLLRIYLLWRWFADYTLADLPRRYTLAGFSRVKLGTTFILKRTLSSWYGFFYLAFGYIVACTIFGYWYRSAELTACQFVPMPVHRGSNITTILHPGCFNGKNIYFMRKKLGPRIDYVYVQKMQESGQSTEFNSRKSTILGCNTIFGACMLFYVNACERLASVECGKRAVST
jgi:hypothetical protein